LKLALEGSYKDCAELFCNFDLTRFLPSREGKNPVVSVLSGVENKGRRKSAFER